VVWASSTHSLPTQMDESNLVLQVVNRTAVLPEADDERGRFR
jgi:hypothetical protein